MKNQQEMLYNGFGQATNLYEDHAKAVVTSGGTASPDVLYGYTYGTNAAGATYSRETSTTDPGGRVITLNYNTADPTLGSLDGAISRLSNLADGSTHLEEYGYLGLDTIVIRNRPRNNTQLTYYLSGGSGDGLDPYVGLDRFGRIDDQRWVNGSTDLDRFQYGYDADGNALYRLNTVSNSNSELYHAGGSGNGYDQLNRLVEFTRGTLNGTDDSITGTASRDQQFNLDAVGNWTSLVTNGGTQTRSVNAQNQYTSISGGSGNTPTYDNDGNTTQSISNGNLEGFVYDAWNRIVTVKAGGTTTIETLTYMPGDQASATDVCGGVQTDSYYSMAGQIIEDDTPACGCGGTTTSTYVWGEDYVNDLVERDKSGTRVYAEHDANWDITSLVNSNATPSVLERFEYDPYGTRTVLTASWGNTTDSQGWVYGFQGGRHDVLSGLIHFQARDLNVTLGRWMQEDPWGGRYIDGTNLYQAFGGAPACGVDPAGTDFIALADHPVPISLYLGSHYSLDYWETCGRGPTTEESVSDYLSEPTDESLHAKRLFSVQLEPQTWRIWVRQTAGGRDGRKGPVAWLNGEVQVSVIEYDNDKPENILSIYDGNGNDVAVTNKWIDILEAAKAYPYAEQPDTTVAKHWPDSHYQDPRDGSYNNSNSFIRSIMAAVGLTGRLRGWHPGNTFPRPVRERWYGQVPWAKGSEPQPMPPWTR